MAFYQKLFIEQELPDYLRANIVDTPDDVIVRSATSNYQRRPSCLVLVDGKYPLSGLVRVEVERSRNLSANTATITLQNFDHRYSGPNQYKLASNIEIAIFFGYEDHYVQRFQGFIDQVKLRTEAHSTITIECRDSAKPFIDQTISAGIYSQDSDYLGENDWHFEPKWNSQTGVLIKFPKVWTYSEVIRDVMYIMGKADIKAKVNVVRSLDAFGNEVFTRQVTFGPEYRINIPVELDAAVTANFVEEAPLDVLSQLVQAVLCEAHFDETGVFVVEPLKDGTSTPKFYMREERDIISLGMQHSDDNMANIATVIGQTADETAVIYPFAAIAAKEDITLEKAQDIFGYSLNYPDCVAQENWHTLKKPTIYAPVVSPGSIFPDYTLNPENSPKYDTRIYFPTFANPFKKQEVLSGSYQLITSTADNATEKNTRQWFFHGETEDANQHEAVPIYLFDRFGKPLKCVAKVRKLNISNDPVNEDDQKWTKLEVRVQPSAEMEITTEDGVGAVDAATLVLDGPLMTGALNRWQATGWGRRTFSGVDLPPALQGALNATSETYDITSVQIQRTDSSTPIGFSAVVSVYSDEFVCFQVTDTSSNASQPSTLTAFGPEVEETRVASVVKLTGLPANFDSLCINCKLEYDTDQGSAQIVPMPPSGSTGAFTMKYPIVFFKPKLGYPAGAILYNEYVYTYSYFELAYVIQSNIEATLDARGSASSPPLLFRVYVGGGLIGGLVDLSDQVDINCEYWRWYGSMDRDNPVADPRFHPVEITKSEYYGEAADPMTVVFEVLPDSYDGKASTNILSVTEEYLVITGENWYGDMTDVTGEFASTLARALDAIVAAIIALALSQTPPNWSAIGIILVLYLYARSMISSMADLGRNISKQLIPVTGRVWAGRQNEIEQVYNAQHAFKLHWDWRATLRDEVVPGEPALPVGYPNFANGDYNMYDYFQYEDDDGNKYMVFIFDIGTGNYNAEVPGSDLALFTAFGWETPEIGDRRLIEYYNFKDYLGEDVEYRVSLIANFKLEAFGNTETLQKRFYKQYLGGVEPEPDDDWISTSKYELLVDRSMSDISITDYGLWYDFFERREDYVPRRYKYAALMINTWKVQQHLSPTAGVADPEPVNIVTELFANPSLFHPDIFFCREGFGVYIPRGLDQAHYLANKRWLADRTEHNMATVRPLHFGQNTLVAHLYCNFAWNPCDLAIRIWGKAYGKYAPSVIYYAESDLLSIETYGNREVVLTNPCINSFTIAKYLAEHLAIGSIQTFELDVTGKGYVNEGDIIMVKEESSGIIAGTFRTWENTFVAPLEKECTGIANQLVAQTLVGIDKPAFSTPTSGNYTLMCSGDSNSNAYIVEVDTGCTPVWFARLATGKSGVAFAIRTAEPNKKTIVGLKHRQTISVLDYPDTNLTDRYNVMSTVNGGCLTDDYEQRFLFVATASGIACLDLNSGQVQFIQNIGVCLGVACGVWKAWRPESRTNEPSFDLCNALIVLRGASIQVYKMFDDFDYSTGLPVGMLGNLVSSYTASSLGITFNNPKSIEYSRSLREIVYVDGETTSTAAVIYGIAVEVVHDPEYPDQFEFKLTGVNWKIDYTNDAELTAKYPNLSSRIAYIQQFFSPVHAIRDVNADLLVTDSVHNKVYRVNPSGKLYVVSVTDSFSRSDSEDKYTSTIKAIPVDCAMSVQLTNFGVNFIQYKTDEQIEAEKTTAMGRVVGTLPRDKYLVKLLTSDTIVTATNSSGDTYRVNDTVLVVKGFTGSSSFSIIGRKDLYDWVVETGSPYIIVDATTIDVTKYGEVYTSSSNTSNVDLTTIQTQISVLQNRVRQLGRIHGITF